MGKILSGSQRRHKHIKQCKDNGLPIPRWCVTRRSEEASQMILQMTRDTKLAAGCMDCGYNKHFAALQFDHRPGEIKLFDLAKSKWHTITKVKQEMAKCDVVCANCHSIRTYTRMKEKIKHAP